MADVFNVAIFFIILRETLEAAMIVSVLLSFAKQMFDHDPSSYKRIRKHIWVGSVVGFSICLVLGAIFIALWYTVANDAWGAAENLWEGIFSLIAVIMITAMGLGMLRSGHMKEKWSAKLATALEEPSERTGWKRFFNFKIFSKKYLFFHLPFFTVLREGLEAVVFVGGVTMGTTAKSIPLAAIVGLISGLVLGYMIYRTGNAMSFHWFFVVSTIFLYLIAAGLMSKAVFFLEMHTFAKYAGADPDAGGVIDVRVNVWALDYGNPEFHDNGGWEIFNAILGWNNVATYGTIISYCLYWFFLALYIVYQGIRDSKSDRLNAIEGSSSVYENPKSSESDKLQPNVEVVN